MVRRPPSKSPIRFPAAASVFSDFVVLWGQQGSAGSGNRAVQAGRTTLGKKDKPKPIFPACSTD
jgi:hypothetical protein